MDTQKANEQAVSVESPIKAQVELARCAQPPWSAFTIRARLQVVRRFRGLLPSRAEEWCRVAREELGKEEAVTLSGDILPLAEACKFLGRRAQSILAPRRVARSDTPWMFFGSRATVEKIPRGVVGVIGTWNYPFFLSGVQILQALVAGNGVVFKPSEVAPRCSALLAALLQEAGLPPGIFQMVSHQREFGPALVSGGIDHVVFTGSLPVGRMVAGAAAERLVTSTLELSGCDPLIALEDAEPALVARSAWFGAVINQGQTCVATRRVLASHALLEKVEAQLVPLVNGVHPFRLVRPSEGEKAIALAREAVSQGARWVGGEPAGLNGEDGCPPLVLAGVRPEMRIAREALFAPVLCLMGASNDEQLIALEESCPFCLGASVFSARLERARHVADRLRSPNVSINEVVIPLGHPSTPIVARGDSGWGSTQGAEGLLEMTLPRVIFQAASGPWAFRPHLEMVPRAGEKSPDMTGLLRAMLVSGHDNSWTRRLTAGLSMPGKAWKWWKGRT